MTTQPDEISVKMSTPWGASQYVYQYAEGIRSVGTAGHGGFWLSAARQKEMQHRAPALFAGQWYEEDCEWARVALAFSDLEHFQGKIHDEAIKTLKTWSPDAYEKHFEETIPEGESYMKDKMLFEERNAHRWQGICAQGDWHEDCPEGMVLVTAKIGGREGNGEAVLFLVPDAEYQSRGPHSFIVDPEKHARKGSAEKTTKEVTAGELLELLA